jgi:hypothetical protein
MRIVSSLNDRAGFAQPLHLRDDVAVGGTVVKIARHAQPRPAFGRRRQNILPRLKLPIARHRVERAAQTGALIAAAGALAQARLAALPEGALDPRSRLIMLYALCGFANFSSLGIMIAGLATMCPAKRDEVVSLGLKSIVSGTLTTCLLGAIVGVLS